MNDISRATSHRVAIVTGAGRGLGRAMARGLARAGIRVVITAARERGEIDATASAINREFAAALARVGGIGWCDRETVIGCGVGRGARDIRGCLMTSK